MSPETKSVGAASSRRPPEPERKGIRYRLLLIEALVFIVPVIVLVYVIQGKDLVFDASQIFIFLFLLAVVLGGFLLLRQILDSIARIATLSQKIEAGDLHSIEVDAEEKELKEISGSINSLLKKLEKSTELANHRLFELLSIKEFAEAVRREQDQEGLLRLLLENAAALSGARRGWILHRREIGEDLKLLSSLTLEEGAGPAFSEYGWAGLSQRMEADAKPLFLTGEPGNFTQADPNSRADFLAMPVLQDRSLAAMLVLDAAPGGRGFSTHDSYILSIMIDQIALGYERRGLHQELSWRIEELKRRTGDLENEVSHRKEAEAGANEANVFLRSILESSSSISIVSTDINGNILYWNKGAENIFGYRASEMVGRKKIDVLYGGDDQTSEVIEETRALVLGQKRKITCEIQEVAKDGRSIWVRLNLTSRRDESGRVAGILGIGEDITERKRLEQMLLHAEKMKALGTLAGGIAHDFNNILGGILAYAEAAQMKRDDPEKVSQCLDQVLKASHRAKDLVRQILDFSRQAAQERKPIPLGPVALEALKLLQGILPATIHMRQDIEADAGIVRADPTQVHQVIMNLVTNASQAMWEKGGDLRVSLANREIPSSSTLPDPELSPGAYVVLSVSDTGHGMEKAVLDRIFEPYFTTKAQGEG
ncbi:MAG: PAS domain S-box protein, partial [Proteobacteria bacterium]|nr:PAS domain S-box protein [Pseudomonadota bacterium]